jgi:hypothetical protein
MTKEMTIKIIFNRNITVVVLKKDYMEQELAKVGAKL